MPSIDTVVLAAILLGAAAAVPLLRRRGARGGRLWLASFTALHGVVLAASMSAHTLDVISRLAAGRSHAGEPFPYDFRAYALLLLGVLMVAIGVALLRAAPGIGRGEPAARAAALRAAAASMALVLPLLPIQRFFAVPLSALGAAYLAVLVVASRGGAEARAEAASPAEASPAEASPAEARESRPAG